MRRRIREKDRLSVRDFYPVGCLVRPKLGREIRVLYRDPRHPTRGSVTLGSALSDSAFWIVADHFERGCFASGIDTWTLLLPWSERRFPIRGWILSRWPDDVFKKVPER